MDSIESTQPVSSVTEGSASSSASVDSPTTGTTSVPAEAQPSSTTATPDVTTTQSSSTAAATAPAFSDEQVESLPENARNPIRQMREHIRTLESQLNTQQQSYGSAQPLVELATKVGGAEVIQGAVSLAESLFANTPEGADEAIKAIYQASPSAYTEMVKQVLKYEKEGLVQALLPELKAMGWVPAEEVKALTANVSGAVTAEELADIPPNLHDTYRRLDPDARYGLQSLDAGARNMLLAQAQKAQQFEDVQRQQTESQQRERWDREQTEIQQSKVQYHESIRSIHQEKLKGINLIGDQKKDNVLREAALDFAENSLYRNENLRASFIDVVDKHLDDRETLAANRLKPQLVAHAGQYVAEFVNIINEMSSDARKWRDSQRQQTARPEIPGVGAASSQGAPNSNGAPRYLDNRGRLDMDRILDEVRAGLPRG